MQTKSFLFIALALVLGALLGITLVPKTPQSASQPIQHLGSNAPNIIGGGGTNSSSTINTTTTVILAANTNRIYALITNDSTGTCYIKLANATSATSEGIRINASGGAYEINPLNAYTGVITGVCPNGPGVFAVTEK